MREANDGVHRRADLVTHVCEEHGLHLRGTLGLLFGHGQLLLLHDQFLLLGEQFLLGLRQLIRLFLELAGLLLGLAEQFLRAKIARENLHAHRDHGQQLFEQCLLVVIEGAERSDFEHSQQRVLGHHRPGGRLVWSGLAKAPEDFQIARRKMHQGDRLALAGALAEQTLARAE